MYHFIDTERNWFLLMKRSKDTRGHDDTHVSKSSLGLFFLCGQQLRDTGKEVRNIKT